MGKVIDSTNILSSSMSLKSHVYKNMDKNNHYLKTLQQKLDYDWKYRYNIVDIEEENIFASQKYNDIEVAIQGIYSVTQKKILSDDWKTIIFKDIQHPIMRGKKYRFSLDFQNNDKIDNDDKNVWLTVNCNTTAPTASAVIRRCDSYINIVSKQTQEIHKEPIIIEDDFKYVNTYYDTTITIAQGQIYGILQYNKYTKNIKINDRFIIGPTDLEDLENNKVFKVVSLTKFHSEKTFKEDEVKMLFLALDFDSLSEKDDYEKRIAVHNPYYIENEKDEGKNENNDNNLQENKQYHIRIDTKDNTEYNSRLYLKTQRDFCCYLVDDDNNKIETEFNIDTNLLSTENDIYYYDFSKINNHEFSIYNKKMYLKDKLEIICKTEYESIIYEEKFYIELGGIT